MLPGLQFGCSSFPLPNLHSDVSNKGPPLSAECGQEGTNRALPGFVRLCHLLLGSVLQASWLGWPEVGFKSRCASAQIRLLLVWLLPPRHLAGTQFPRGMLGRVWALEGRQQLLSHLSGGQGRGSVAPPILCLQGALALSGAHHVERISARKDMFPPSFLEGGSRRPGDSREILGVWTDLLPSQCISEQPGRCTPSAGSCWPQAPSQLLLPGPAPPF